MPEFSSEVRNGHVRTTVHLAPGEKVSLCRCYKSKTFPLCDAEHRHLEGDFAEYGPVIVDCPLPEPPSEPAA